MRFAALFGVAVIAAGCGLDGAESFRAASPSRQGINITVPQSQGLSSQQIAARLNEPNIARTEVLGQTAEFYQFTVVVTGFVNGSVWAILNLVEDIIQQPPTTVTKTEAVWGPYTAPLSPITYKFTMTASNGGISYVLQGKPKTADDTAYVSLLTGNHQPTGQNAGQGQFVLDLNASHSLNNDPNQAGTVAVQYARDTSANLVVMASFQGVVDQSTGQLVDANYGFAQQAGADGDFEFVLTKDFDGKGQLETLAVKSRWQQDGAGRSDVLGSGGDLGSTQILASECWDSNFKETYYQDNLNINPTQGSASACVFATADYYKP